MITGYDSVLVAHGPVAPAIERFFDRWSARWPQPRIATDSEGSGEFLPWAPGAMTWAESTDHVLVARDEEMLRHWDESGYALDARGEGPFALMYKPAEWRTLKAVALEDPYVRTSSGYEPYEITVAGSQLWMVTVVTPDEEVFRRSVVDTLTACF
ncbi:hypothetical protein [Streptomyces sp. NPDC047928]|uniref:hypothetical protein n=1 Tax=unclassified Streptomyces TaxID=2593676 RepID=UPI0037170B69